MKSPKLQTRRFLPSDLARLLRLFLFTVLATLTAQSVVSCYAFRHSPEAQGRSFLDLAQTAFQEKIVKKLSF